MKFCLDVLRKEVRFYDQLRKFKNARERVKLMYDDYKAAYDYLGGTTDSLTIVPTYSISKLSRQLLWLEDQQTINEVNNAIQKLKIETTT